MVCFSNHFSFLKFISRYFTKYAFQTIMVYNVFQLSFKLKESIRGKLFSIIWDTECCLLVSSQHLVTIRESLWLPFRFSDYKTRQFPTNFILRVFLHYLLYPPYPKDRGMLWFYVEAARRPPPVARRPPPAARNGVNAITQKPRDGLFSNLVYTLVVIVSWPD